MSLINLEDQTILLAFPKGLLLIREIKLKKEIF